jgi:hypothetical protein
MSVVYVPDMVDIRTGRIDSALARAYPEHCFGYDPSLTLAEQLKDISTDQYTVAVVHGFGWHFFSMAISCGYFPNVKHVIALAPKMNQDWFSLKKYIHPLRTAKTIHVVPVDGPQPPQFTESDIIKDKSVMIVRLHGMHPDMQQCYYKNEEGEDAREDEPVRTFLPDELRNLVQSLVNKYVVPDEEDIHV